jgi:hypothetical protein
VQKDKVVLRGIRRERDKESSLPTEGHSMKFSESKKERRTLQLQKQEVGITDT